MLVVLSVFVLVACYASVCVLLLCVFVSVSC